MRIASLAAVLLAAMNLVVWAGSSTPQGPTNAFEVPHYPGFRQICINEIQTDNRATAYDNRQETDAWIELFNPSNKAVLLDTYFLSDNYYQFRKWRFPKGTSIGPTNYLVVWIDGQREQSQSGFPHASFRLKQGGGNIALSMDSNGLPLVIDYVDYPEIGPDLSWGAAFVPGGSRMQLMTRPTPGEANTSVPTVIINELFISPSSGPGWFELYNPDSKPVNIGSLVLLLVASDVVLNPFVIPKGRSIKPNGFLRVWADGKPELNATDPTSLHAPFLLVSRALSLQLLTSTGAAISQFVTKASDPKRPEVRYPDGARNIEYVNVATPGAPNQSGPKIEFFTPSQRLVTGKDIEIKVVASGSPTLRYSWTRNGIARPETTSNMVLHALSPADSGLYTVVVRNAAGSASREMVLTVLEPPAIEQSSPPIIDVGLGRRLNLPSKIAGTGPYVVQWKRNGQNIDSANQQDYTKEALSLDDGGIYTAVVRNEAGVVLSTQVRVDIPDVPRIKVADDFADAADLGAKASGSVRGNNAAATKERGEPAHAGNDGGHSVWFSWLSPTTGIARFNTRGSAFDTLLAIYQGKSVVTLDRIESDDDRGGFYTSDLRFNAVKGQEYFIAIDGYGGDTNEFILSWDLTTTTAKLPVIDSHPASTTVKPGARAIFRVAATDAISYQWYFNNSPINGATENVLTVSPASIKNVGIYRVSVLGRNRLSVDSYDARLELGDVEREPSQDKYEPPFRRFTGIKLPILGEIELASVIPVSVSAGVIGNQTLTTAGSGTQLTEAPTCGAIGGSSRFQVFQPASTCDVIIDTIGSTYNTVIAVYSVTSKGEFRYINCGANGSVSELMFNAVVGNIYYAFVDSQDGTSGVTVMNWRCGGLPILLSPTPPQTNSIAAGTDKSYTIIAAANPPLQRVNWLLNESEISSGLDQTYSITTAAPEHSGDYYVILINAMGSSTGKVANLYVETPIELSISRKNTDSGAKALLEVLAKQGFVVETSTDFVNWCSFTGSGTPSVPFNYTITNTLLHPRLFFRCQPWPSSLPYVLTPCEPDFP